MSKYLFGPVASRRLGRSLGIDLVPMKTCTYNCIYCQLGPTNCKTVERKEWVPLDAVLEELDQGLRADPDYITLSGSGEPTLFSRLDELLSVLKRRTRVPVAVLTNGSLLWQEEVQDQLQKADLVIPSLDAGSEEVFRLVNRPHAEIAFQQMLDGLVTFRRRFRGEMWLEVFLLAAYTTFDDELDRLRRCVERIGPDRVQLNTVTRPPAESFALPVSNERLHAAARIFQPPAEVIPDYSPRGIPTHWQAGREEILALLRRRPCSLQDIVAGLGIHPNEAIKHLTALTSEELVGTAQENGRTYYQAADRAGDV